MELLNVIDLLKGAQVLEQKISVALLYTGLRIPQFMALEFIDFKEKSTVTEISRQFKITRATASVLVSELIKSNAVATVENLSDRRSFHIKLTEAGRNRLTTGRRDIAEVRQRISKNYSEETIRVLNAFSKEVKWRNIEPE